MRFESIVKDNASSSMEERFKSVMGPEDRKTSQLGETKWPMIPKVPQLLRGTKDFTEQFEPYHYHKPELKPAEMMKRQMTKRFILDSGQCIEVLYNKIAEPSEVTYSPKEEKGPHLLDLLRRRLQGIARVPKRVARKGWNSYRIVNELKAAGISIKPNKGPSEVTSYICFLHLLVDELGDVKELRQQGVLRNFLGSDEEVATQFNEITADLTYFTVFPRRN
ncbi:hypothetical protein CK203_027126 [Vitis vinifera]|uniref:Uncharacterized protein n=1 Tax=Vitis vinifera TaxID=29760 RepID=A0A438I6G4_VITVI|nr:hypothetical protein CK203_027126 [Vitis vinifera]